VIISKTIKCRILNPTKHKFNILNREWENYQDFIELEKNDLDWLADKVPLYSSYSHQARWYWSKFRKQNFPISLLSQILKIKETNNKLSKYWVRILVKSKYGGIWLAVKPHCNFPKDCKLGESKLIKRDNYFEIHVIIKKEVEIKKSYSSILAIDIGEKVLATVLLDGRPIFMGKELRGIRGHYAWLRKRLGERKLLKVIKRISDKESRIIDIKIHEISKQIVSLAYQYNSLILIGNLKGIRKSTRGKRFNRIVSSMPYYKLTNYIEYKANWKGIKVIKTDEKKTSKTCSKCGYENKGNRRNQGLFKCKRCEYQVNADFNGAKNIKNRFEDYMSSNGVMVQTLSRGTRYHSIN